MLKQNAIRETDIAVIGGGPAGAAIALELTRSGYSTVVIERSDYCGVRIGETLPPAIKPLLINLGVWDQFVAQNHAPAFGVRSVWGGDNIYDNDFIFNPHGAGWHVDRASFDEMLASCAEQAGAELYRKARSLTCENGNAGWSIEFAGDDGTHRFRAKFLVDATGRTSYVARQQGAKRITGDRLIGVFFFFSLISGESAIDDSTLIEAVEDGWWYSAGLPESRLVFAYMTDADLFARARKQTNFSCLRKLQQTKHSRVRVEPYVLTSGPLIVPANSSRLDRSAKGNWLAIGDAAMAFDPLSGQGVYKALQSALRAAEAIDQHLTGNTSALSDYSAAVDQDFDRYLSTRRMFYSKERRWPGSTFWKRRVADGITANHKTLEQVSV